LANVKKRVDQRVQLHKLLSERKIKNNEIVQEYLLKMKEIASSGSVDKCALMQYVIDGINDLSVNKSILYNAKDLKEFKEKLKSDRRTDGHG